MDTSLQQLLSKKVGFFKKLFNKVYSKEIVTEAFNKGKAICEKLWKDKLEVVVKENERLTIEVKDLKKTSNDLDLKVKAKASLNNDLSGQLTKSNEYSKQLEDQIKQLEKDKSNLVTKVDSLTSKLKENDKVQDVKALEKKLKEQEEKHKKEMQSALKNCTDEFMKTINKLDKEKEKLQSSLDKFVNRSTKTKNAEKSGQPAFTCEQVKKIKEANKNGKTSTMLAEEYGVDRTTIDRLLSGKTYKKCK